MDQDEFKMIWDEVEKAYRLTSTPEEFLNAVLRIWVQNGLVKGEMSCSIDKAG